MIDKPKIITRGKNREEFEGKDFSFTRDLVRLPDNSDLIKNYREKAWTDYLAFPLPNTQMDAWRRTNLHKLNPANFRFPKNGEYIDLPEAPKQILQSFTSDQIGGQVLLLAGGAKISLSPELSSQGVIFTDLLTAEKVYPRQLERVIGQIVKPSEGKFAAMAGSLAQNGVFLYIPKGVVVNQPLHSFLWGPGSNLAYISHLMVYLEEGASMTYIHEAISPTTPGEYSMHAGLVEIFLGPSSNLQFVELQSWGEKTWNFSHERVRLEKDSNLDWIFGSVGSHLTKNFSDLDLVGQGSTGKMSGFYFTSHDQHLDHDTQQNHLAKNTTSDLLFKGALLDNSRSVWQGMIYVSPDAEKTDGYQVNRNLILSPNARADSIPGLEILADDVKCSHGATVGKLDQDQLFYLLSRGIPKIQAEKLLVEGFFEPIMQRISADGVRERFRQAIHNKMGN